MRNGSASTTKSPDFPANAIVSHAFTFTIAIAPIAGLRNGLGTAIERKRQKEQAARDEAVGASTRADAPAPAGDAQPQVITIPPAADPVLPSADPVLPAADPGTPGPLSLHPRHGSPSM